MSARTIAPDSVSKFGPYAAHVDRRGGRRTLPTLEAGERLGGPPRRGRGKVIGTLLVVALMGGGGWAWSQHPEKVAAMSEWMASVVTPLLHKSPRSVAAPMPAPEPFVPPLETREAPPATLVPASAELPLPAPRSDAPDADPSAPVQPLPPAVADPADPHQVRALAAGLHPGLSRALLARLSDADYRNAETAIRTALAETPDAEVFAYPRKRSGDLALFQVKFVRGITPDCRRYVVMVTKDGWLTTAMPMEKCGIKRKQARK